MWPPGRERVGCVMARRGVRHGSIAAIACMLLAGCTQTSRVDDNLSTAALADTRKAVAVMRVGAASPSCINVAVLLGVRDGAGFRRHQGITVMNVRSLTEPAVAEVELDPGEYHVLAYRCQSARSIKTVGDGADHGTYRTSFASFTLYPGEVVNVGYLHFGLAAQRARPLQGQTPTRLCTDEDAPDDGDAPRRRHAHRPGLRSAQGAEGGGQGGAAAAGMRGARRCAAHTCRSCQVRRQLVSPQGTAAPIPRSRLTPM